MLSSESQRKPVDMKDSDSRIGFPQSHVETRRDDGTDISVPNSLGAFRNVWLSFHLPASRLFWSIEIFSTPNHCKTESHGASLIGLGQQHTQEPATQEVTRSATL